MRAAPPISPSVRTFNCTGSRLKTCLPCWMSCGVAGLTTPWARAVTTPATSAARSPESTPCELYDASPLLLEANTQFVGNAEFPDLPRKFKMCITGCNVWCSYPLRSTIRCPDPQLAAVKRLASRCAWPDKDFRPILIWRAA